MNKINFKRDICLRFFPHILHLFSMFIYYILSLFEHKHMWFCFDLSQQNIFYNVIF